ncbi:MAG: LptE family protein [Bacteroidales bacterium]|nr:LptE family protein [Bacteroidales bacterium]
MTNCRIKYSFTGASISPEVKTFSVSYIENVARYVVPTLSTTLTESLKDKLLSETSLRMINSEADLEFEGKITGYDQSYTGERANETAALNKLTITLSVSFTNNKEPNKSFQKSFDASREYPSDKSLNDVEAGLIMEMSQEIIDKVFSAALADW